MKRNLFLACLIFCCAQIFWGGEVWGQCTVTITDNAAYTLAANNNNAVICINTSGTRSSTINIGANSGVRLVISSNTTFTGSVSQTAATRYSLDVNGVIRGDITLNNGSSLTVLNGGQYNSSGTLTVTDGSVDVRAGGTISRPVTLNNSSTYSNSGTQSEQVTINNTAAYTSSSVTSNNVTLNGTGSQYTITPSGSQTGGSLTVTNGTFTNQGNNSRGVTLSNSAIFNNSGTQSEQVTINNSAAYTSSSVTSNNVTLNGTGSQYTITPSGSQTGGSLTVTDGTFTNQGNNSRQVTLSNSAIFNNSGTQTGNVTLNNTSSIDNSGILSPSSLNFNSATVSFTNTSSGNLTVSNSTILKGSINFEGIARFNNGVDLDGNTTVLNVKNSGSLTISNTLTLKNGAMLNLSNTSNLTPKSKVQVKALSFIDNGSGQTLTVGENTEFNVTDDTSIDANLSSLIIKGVFETNNLYVRDRGNNTPPPFRINLGDNGSLLVKGNASINRPIAASQNGQFTVNGNFTLEDRTSNSFAISDNVKFSVLGDASFNGPFTVTGKAEVAVEKNFTIVDRTSNSFTLADSTKLTVKGNISLNRDVTIMGNSSVNVTGNFILEDQSYNSLLIGNKTNLTIGGDMTLNKPTVISGDAEVKLSGNFTVADRSPNSLTISDNVTLSIDKNVYLNKPTVISGTSQIDVKGTLTVEDRSPNSLELQGSSSLSVDGFTKINKPVTISDSSTVSLKNGLLLEDRNPNSLTVSGKSSLLVNGTSDINAHFQANTNSVVTFDGNVNMYDRTGSIIELSNNANVLITGNLTKSGNGGKVDVKNSSQLTICHPSVPSGSGAAQFPADTSSDNIFVSVLGYYGSCRILPVEFLSFTGTYQTSSRSAVLNWTTAKEWENSHFEIERAVNSVNTWETIGRAEGSGYSDQPLDYAYEDTNLPPAGGNIFYRLKQRDFNGDVSYSDIKSIRFGAMSGTSLWRVFPNPTTGNPINLEVIDRGLYHDEPITVRIISATGQFEVIESKAGSPLDALISDRLINKPAGVYTLEINWGIQREYHRIVLTR